jgi:hypothetical protein
MAKKVVKKPKPEPVAQKTQTVKTLRGLRVIGKAEYYVIGELTQRWPGLNNIFGSGVVTDIDVLPDGAVVRFADGYEEHIIGSIGLMYETTTDVRMQERRTRAGACFDIVLNG